ncbi:uncharacterized protein [Dermacentor albipictus]|uniref:uncharacterized protein isoform X2 n=1 Tax=Dermacentor albipictus TaxID=60249 RepID=UPI0031FCE6B9
MVSFTLPDAVLSAEKMGASAATPHFVPEQVFTIVRFVGDNQVEAVPTCWLKNGMCFWPTGYSPSRLKKAIMRCETPDRTFERHKIRVIGTASTYKRAREKAIVGEDTENIAFTDGERGRGKRRYAHKYMEVSCSCMRSPSCNSDDEDNKPPETAPIGTFCVDSPEDYSSAPQAKRVTGSMQIPASQETTRPTGDSYMSSADWCSAIGSYNMSHHSSELLRPAYYYQNRHMPSRVPQRPMSVPEQRSQRYSSNSASQAKSCQCESGKI